MGKISIEKVWEDSDFFEIEVSAKSEMISAKVRSYTTIASINELALRLESFPQTPDDRYLWENGTKGDNSTAFVSFEVWCENKLGNIIMEIYMEIDDGGSYDKHNCCFFIKTESGALNSFGRSLRLLNREGIGEKITLN